MQNWKMKMTRRMLVAVVAMVAIASLAGYEFANTAKAAVAAPAAAPLDDSSVAALLTLDRAMETLAARVTPAVVNVTVSSKPSATRASIALAEAAATAETARISAGRGFIFAATIDQLSELHLHAWSIPCVENLIARQVPLASTKDERSHGRTGALDPLTGDQ